ncbi:MAG: hypothetical protein IJ138_01930 [Clostridia bacterium]|nr:hypothetical protein [Clostridia bacterium]
MAPAPNTAILIPALLLYRFFPHKPLIALSILAIDYMSYYTVCVSKMQEIFIKLFTTALLFYGKITIYPAKAYDFITICAKTRIYRIFEKAEKTLNSCNRFYNLAKNRQAIRLGCLPVEEG